MDTLSSDLDRLSLSFDKLSLEGFVGKKMEPIRRGGLASRVRTEAGASKYVKAEPVTKIEGVKAPISVETASRILKEAEEDCLVDRGVSAEAFMRWLAVLGDAGIDEAGAADLLGVHSRSVKRAKQRGGNWILALAMSAVLNGVEGWK